jgi:hypothetical protein
VHTEGRNRSRLSLDPPTWWRDAERPACSKGSVHAAGATHLLVQHPAAAQPGRDPRAVAHAGLVLPATPAERLGIQQATALART